MAAARGKNQPQWTSPRWILEERNQADTWMRDEIDDFELRARNEMEWLNEHMAEVLESNNQVPFTDVFKTPGKLRGKTPRTARKRNPLEQREPLGDIFTSNVQSKASPPKQTAFQKQLASVRSPEDKENGDAPPIPPRSPLRNTPHRNTPQLSAKQPGKNHYAHQSVATKKAAESTQVFAVLHEDKMGEPARLEDVPAANDSSNDSFMSAMDTADEGQLDGETGHFPRDETIDHPGSPRGAPPKAVIPEGLQSRHSHLYSVSAETADGLDDAMDGVESAHPGLGEHDLEMKDVESTQYPELVLIHSNTASPKAMARKKSSFAKLPERMPWTKKNSVGAHTARQSETKTPGSRVTPSVLSKWDADSDNDSADLEEEEEEQASSHEQFSKPASQTSNLNSKTSTQRLHERITMLGQTTNPSRLSKSTVSTVFTSQSTAQDTQSQSTAPTSLDDEDDDSWIGPHDASKSLDSHAEAAGNSQIPEEPYLERTETSKPDTYHTALVQPASPPKQTYPTLTPSAGASTTPAGSPIKTKHIDGPISDAKSRFQSLLQSAKSMFATSAGIGIDAQKTVLSPSSSRGKLQKFDHDGFAAVVEDNDRPKSAYSRLELASASDGLTEAPAKRRSSRLAKDKETGARSTSLTGNGQPRKRKSDALDSETAEIGPTSEMAAQLENETMPIDTALQHSENQRSDTGGMQVQKTGENKRPKRPGQIEQAKKRHGPAPVPIRLPSQAVKSTHSGQPSSSNINSSDQAIPKSTGPPSNRTGTVKKQPSNSTLRTASAQSNRGAGQSTVQRPAALIAADKKKAQDEREAKRKEEQKRGLERKRAAKVEEERRLAQEQRDTEQRKAQEAKLAAQRQAEQRKADASRRLEQQQQKSHQAQLSRPKTAEGSDRVDQNYGQFSKSTHAEGRPMSRQANHADSMRVHTGNQTQQAQNGKRYWQPDAEEDTRYVVAPKQAMGNAASSFKRQRTSEEGVNAPSGPSGLTSGAPIRQSNMRKDVPNKFTQGFMTAQQPGHSMLKTAVTTSHNHQQQHPKTPHGLAQYSNAQIPFAESSTGPQTAQKQRFAQLPNKTPLTTYKSSPQYPNGDNISLPDINTDSEDDDDDDFVPPAWADSPELRKLLADQQLVDPRGVFGPIGPLDLQEVFRAGGKEHKARFRNRTSSANWDGPDRLTEEERRKDQEAREKLEKDKAWTYQQTY